MGWGFEGMSLRWFVGKDEVIWIKRKMVWFEWKVDESLCMMWLIKFNKL